MKEIKNIEDLPKWLKYILIAIAILFLITTCFQFVNPESLHFPIF